MITNLGVGTQITLLRFVKNLLTPIIKKAFFTVFMLCYGFLFFVFCFLFFDLFYFSLFFSPNIRIKHDQAQQATGMQLDDVSNTENVRHTNLVAYMTTVSEEVQNSADVNTVKEDMYHYIPDESDEYSQAYMDVTGEQDIQMTSDTSRSGNQASEDYYERVGNQSEDDQQAYISLILEDIEKENHKEIAPHVYTPLKQKNRGKKQEKATQSKKDDTDAPNQFYINDKVVENMKRVKRF